MAYPYDGVDLKKHPESYRIGRGEQGVVHAEPYKCELLPLWKFKTAEEAGRSSRAIFGKFLEYRATGDFVGMDVARKYLQMGWTRSRRYAGHKGGNKNRPLKEPDPEKCRAAEDEEYLRLKEEHRRRNRYSGRSYQ